MKRSLLESTHLQKSHLLHILLQNVVCLQEDVEGSNGDCSIYFSLKLNFILVQSIDKPLGEGFGPIRHKNSLGVLSKVVDVNSTLFCFKISIQGKMQLMNEVLCLFPEIMT